MKMKSTFFNKCITAVYKMHLSMNHQQIMSQLRGSNQLPGQIHASAVISMITGEKEWNFEKKEKIEVGFPAKNFRGTLRYGIKEPLLVEKFCTPVQRRKYGLGAADALLTICKVRIRNFISMFVGQPFYRQESFLGKLSQCLF